MGEKPQEKGPSRNAGGAERQINRSAAYTPESLAHASGARFGCWTVIGSDPTGRRLWVRCICGAVRQVSRETLESGESVSCGCARSKNRREPSPRPLPDWRPQR
jgi:hypothetical protein